MQFERFYSLNHRAYWDHFYTYIIYDFSQLSQIWGNLCGGNGVSDLCGGNGVSVLSYAHPQLFKVFKHLIYLCHRCVMQFERFYFLFDGKKVKLLPWGINRCCVSMETMSVSKLMYCARGRWWSW